MEEERPVHEDQYPSRFAMEAAVELEVCAALGRVQTATVGKVIQRAIDRAIDSDRATQADYRRNTIPPEAGPVPV